MKSNAPWSVKGIEKDVRETAKEAARREGMTVGEWLNTVIVQAGDPDTASTGEITGLALRDLATAIEHLSGRVASAESKSQSAIDDLSRTFGGVVERVQRLERSKHEGSDAGAIAERMERLEAKTNDRQRIETLKALERAVGQMALQFDTAHKTSIARLDSNERQMQELAARIEKLSERGGGDGSEAIAFLKDAIDGMSARIGRAERIANEAAKIKSESAGAVDAEFVERTGQRLRVLGDEIKRGGDQMRSLEQAITRLSGQIDAAERRSSEGVEKVSETIAELRDQLSRNDDAVAGRNEIEQAVAELTQRTEDRIAALQSSFEEMLNQLEAAGATPEEAPRPEDAEPTRAFEARGQSAHAVEASAASAVAAAAQPGASSTDFDEEDDLQSELDAAFADLDLGDDDDTATTAAAMAAAPTTSAAKASADAHDSASFDEPAAEFEISDDDFDFDFDEPKSEAETEAADALADVNAAFGVGEKAEKAKAPQSDDDEFDDVFAALDRYKEESAESADDEDDVEAPPMLVEEQTGPFGRKPKADAVPDAAFETEPTSTSDYLKAARAAAKEAAAKAAIEAEEGDKKRKLTPKQRAILAARIKRKREEAAKAAAEAEAKNPPPMPEPEIDEDDEPKTSPFDKIKALLKGKVGKPARDADDFDDEDSAISDGDFTRRPSPHDKKARGKNAPDKTSDGKSRLDARAVAQKKRKGLPVKPTAIALGAGVVLAGAAAFLTLRDNGATEQRATPAPRAAQPAETSLTDCAVQPRDLYFDAMQALATTTSDNGIRAAILELEQAAALGHPPAQLQLGEMYKSGDSVTKDLDQARVWYERAAAGGNVLAMHRLGVMAARGEGGPVEPARSIEWFEQAANLGLVDAQFNLGTTYHPSADGATVFQDREKAFYWYSLAAKNGDSQAGELAAGVGAALSPEKRAELLAEVDLWEPLPVNEVANERAAV